MLVRFGNSVFEESVAAAPARIPLLALGERADETLLAQSESIGRRCGFQLWRSGTVIAGLASASASVSGYSDIALNLYRALFEATDGLNLYRMWNYAPFINHGEGDDECYRRFCEGRAIAFAERFGDGAVDAIPAGSCVGAEGDRLVVAFLAGSAAPRHFENPRQVPAYRYPRIYGPRSPSFARATVAETDGFRYGFVSGTSAVSGHESVGIGDLDAQMRITRENLELMLGTCGIDARSPTLRSAAGKVYLRRSENFEQARAFMDTAFPRFAPSLIYLRSDICRRELLFEAELSTVESAALGG